MPKEKSYYPELESENTDMRAFIRYDIKPFLEKALLCSSSELQDDAKKLIDQIRELY